MIKKVRIPRKRIPKAKRRAIWVKYVGEYIFKAKCLCCNSNTIDPFTFESGHIEAHSKGGSDDISNLVPICSICNRDMGDQNLKIFMQQQFKLVLNNVLTKLNRINNRVKKIIDI
jgi:5-methylcytosine-specific restriction endonuclease McrA